MFPSTSCRLGAPHRHQAHCRQPRDEVIERIGAQVEAGRQVYWVCPLIEESEALAPEQRHRHTADLSEALPA